CDRGVLGRVQRRPTDVIDAPSLDPSIAFAPDHFDRRQLSNLRADQECVNVPLSRGAAFRSVEPTKGSSQDSARLPAPPNGFLARSDLSNRVHFARIKRQRHEHTPTEPAKEITPATPEITRFDLIPPPPIIACTRIRPTHCQSHYAHLRHQGKRA